MSRDDVRKLLGFYATGALSRQDHDRLMKAALADQSLFDELLALEPLRGALDDSQLRTAVRADLRPRVPQRGMSWIGYVRRPVFAFGTLAAAAAAVVTWISIPPKPALKFTPDSVQMIALGSDIGHPIAWKEILSEFGAADVQRAPAAAANPSDGIFFDRPNTTPVYHRGDPIRFGFRYSQTAAIVILEDLPGGKAGRLFPNKFQSSPVVSANTMMLIPPAGQGPIVVDSRPGTHTLRMLIFPPEYDPLAPGRRWDEVLARATVLTRTYQVEP